MLNRGRTKSGRAGVWLYLGFYDSHTMENKKQLLRVM